MWVRYYLSAPMILSFVGVFWLAMLLSSGYWCWRPLTTICHWLSYHCHFSCICHLLVIVPLPFSFVHQCSFSPTSFITNINYTSHVPLYIVPGSFNVQYGPIWSHFPSWSHISNSRYLQAFTLSLKEVARDICPDYCTYYLYYDAYIASLTCTIL